MKIDYQDHGVTASLTITNTVFEFRKHNRVVISYERDGDTFRLLSHEDGDQWQNASSDAGLQNCIAGGGKVNIENDIISDTDIEKLTGYKIPSKQ